MLLGKISLKITPLLTQVATQFAGRMGRALAMDDRDVNRLELAIEEAVSNVIQHYAQAPDHEDMMDLQCELQDHDLIFSVFERGIPFKQRHDVRYSTDSIEAMEQPGLGHHLMTQVMDKVEFLNLGKRGKETRLTKHLDPSEALDRLITQLDTRPEDQKVREPEPIIRQATVDDIDEICRLAWRCWGYSQRELLYDHDALSEMVRRGEYVPFAAYDAAEENMIYHLGLQTDAANRKVIEFALAFTDPNTRSPDLSRRVSDLAVDFITANHFDGFFDKCVSTHPTSQKLSQKFLQTRPCAILLGYGALRRIKLRKVAEQDHPTLVKHYRPLNRAPVVIHPPARYADMIDRIYGWLELERPRGKLVELIDHGEAQHDLTIEEMSEGQNAVILTVRSIGPATLAEIETTFTRCRAAGRHAVFLYLPLNDPACARLADRCAELGFFFGGVMPHIHFGGDRLFLQYFDPVLETGEIRIPKTMTAELLEFIQQDRQRAGEILGST